MLSWQIQFDSWRTKSFVVKSQTEQLKEAAEAIALDILQLEESVSKTDILD